METTTKITPEGKIVIEVQTEIMDAPKISDSPVSSLTPLLQMIAVDWGLKLCTKRDYDIALKILIQSAKNN